MKWFNLLLVKNFPFSNWKTGKLGLYETDFSFVIAAMGQQPKWGKGKRDMYSPFFVLVLGILLWICTDPSFINFTSFHNNVSLQLKVCSDFERISPSLKDPIKAMV
jgi:hypothetical protein